MLTSLAPGEYRVVVRGGGLRAEDASTTSWCEVGRRVLVDAVLEVQGRAEAVDVEESAVSVPTGTSLVGGVVGAGVVENLPLNGRNFLELAFLLPGNAPAPNFDPTKTNSVAISSAGQLGRGGNITIDGQDNNDDVVGGPLANLPQDAVQEFQMATNRFSAEQGRSAAVGRQRGDAQRHRHASRARPPFFLRDDALQGLPATYDRSSGEAPPFDRQQYSATLGGPIVRGKAWWFAAAEYRNQDAVVQVGERDAGDAHDPPDASPRRRSTTSSALARVDVRASAKDTLGLRYVVRGRRRTRRRARSTARSARPRSARRASNRHHQGLVTWTRTLGPTAVNTLRASYSDFRNAIDPVAPGRQLTFPSIQDGASFRVPQGTTQKRWQVADSLSWVKGAHTLRVGGEVVAHVRGVRPRRLPRRARRAGAGLRRSST